MVVSFAAPSIAMAQDAAGPASRIAAARSALTTPRHAAAQAAGFHALHLCTGYFASGAPRAVIDRTAFARAGGTKMDVAVDEGARRISVSYAPDMPARIAQWRPLLGCTQLPIGAGVEMADALPSPAARAPALDAQPWPMGDAGARRPLPRNRAATVERLLEEAFRGPEGTYRGNSWGIVVVKEGHIVAERYAPGFGRHVAARTNSMCKSIASTLTGIGVRKGLVHVDRPAPLAEWRRVGDPRGAITLTHLMHMASGLYTETGGNPQNELYRSGAAAAEVSALGGMDAKPGARFVYAGSDTILLGRALRQAVGDDRAFLTWPHRELLWKVGMTRTTLETDWQGDFLLSGQCWSTARDFARFGMLYLADGMWAGERILPKGWRNVVTRPAPAQPGSAAKGGPRYGGQFWLYGGVDGLPGDAFSPGGALGQFAMIVPSRGVVVVRRGFDLDEGFRIAKFSADLLDALGR